MRPKQRDPGDRRSDNRQQYGSGTHVFRPARQFMEFRPDSVNNGLNSAQNFCCYPSYFRLQQNALRL